MAELVLIGTGHVFRIEETIRDAIEAIQPHHVLVELDPPRLQALYHRAAGGKASTGGGVVHRKLQQYQEEIAESYGAMPGGEMLAAVEAARLCGAKVGLIDRDVNVTMKRAIEQLTWKEKLRAGGSIVKGTVQGWFGKSQNVESELAKYTEDPEMALDELAAGFPTVRRVVIDERDTYMVNNINKLVQDGEKAVVVIGDGHVVGMEKQLQDHELTVYRLPAVRAGELPKPPGSSFRFSFSFQSP